MKSLSYNETSCRGEGVVRVLIKLFGSNGIQFVFLNLWGGLGLDILILLIEFY